MGSILKSGTYATDFWKKGQNVDVCKKKREKMTLSRFFTNYLI